LPPARRFGSPASPPSLGALGLVERLLQPLDLGEQRVERELFATGLDALGLGDEEAAAQKGELLEGARVRLAQALERAARVVALLLGGGEAGLELRDARAWRRRARVGRRHRARV
jgi:hypothetical protein